MPPAGRHASTIFSTDERANNQCCPSDFFGEKPCFFTNLFRTESSVRSGLFKNVNYHFPAAEIVGDCSRAETQIDSVPLYRSACIAGYRKSVAFDKNSRS